MALSLPGDTEANSFPVSLSGANGLLEGRVFTAGCWQRAGQGATEHSAFSWHSSWEKEPWKMHCHKLLVLKKQKVRLYLQLFMFLHNPTLGFCSDEGKTRLSDKIIVKRSEIKICINAYVKQSCREKHSALEDFWENPKMSLIHLCNWDNYVSQWEENEKSMYYYTALSIRKRWLIFKEKSRIIKKLHTYSTLMLQDVHS